MENLAEKLRAAALAVRAGTDATYTLLMEDAADHIESLSAKLGRLESAEADIRQKVEDHAKTKGFVARHTAPIIRRFLVLVNKPTSAYKPHPAINAGDLISLGPVGAIFRVVAVGTHTPGVLSVAVTAVDLHDVPFTLKGAPYAYPVLSEQLSGGATMAASTARGGIDPVNDYADDGEPECEAVYTEPERAECLHDSTRVDEWLDDHCLKCGEDGYWTNGERRDKRHPDGKVLFLPANGDYLDDEIVEAEPEPTTVLMCGHSYGSEVGAPCHRFAGHDGLHRHVLTNGGYQAWPNRSSHAGESRPVPISGPEFARADEIELNASTE